MTVVRALIPLIMIAALVVVALRRRAKKKQRYEDQDGRT